MCLKGRVWNHVYLKFSTSKQVELSHQKYMIKWCDLLNYLKLRLEGKKNNFNFILLAAY